MYPSYFTCISTSFTSSSSNSGILLSISFKYSYFISVRFNKSAILTPTFMLEELYFVNTSFTFSVGLTVVLFNLSISSYICFFFVKNLSYLSSEINPFSCPISSNLRSALSCLSRSLYSALEVIILYGSFVPFVTMSSIKTPIYACDLSRINGSFFCNFLAAFIPAIIPCAAASSYPDVPFICPAKNIPSISLYSSDSLSIDGSIQSYSIAYAGLVNSTCSSPGKVLYMAIWTSSGKEELIPWTYISSVSLPSGSIKTWCLSLSANLTTLSSIEGQYLGPVPVIVPEYRGDLLKFFLIISWVLSFVYVK